MSKHPYSFWQRLRYCWHLLTRRGWLFYCQDGPDHYRVGYTGLTTTDAYNVRRYLKKQAADARAGQQLLDSLHNLNPGIAPAPEQ